MTRIAINGFGRIGRSAARIILQQHPGATLVAINDLLSSDLSAQLFAYDSNYGPYPGNVSSTPSSLEVNGQSIRYYSERNISDLPWKDLQIDVVLECTGVFRKAEQVEAHLSSGARKVVLSSPAKSEGFTTVVLGVNEGEIQSGRHLYSNASCTTNCLAPLAKVLDDRFGIVQGLMTTVHSYTNTQNLLDAAHKDPRRARAAALNIIPTSTGAAEAVGLTLPHLNGKLSGIALRVPTPTVSITDLTAVVKTPTTVEAVNGALQAAAGQMPGIMGFSTLPLVSTDFKQDSRSSIIDAEQTMVQGGTLVKVLSWYDNEWGYSNRLVELGLRVASA
ncbi:type I glyceraldehyde-3-phosphate dehydrogenase [Candidatus Peribacteria bacterium]|nr:type I glyceraldehyde-3-phosphate dehydrogenase [Candidatus Peribacteria bacterium]